MWLAGLLSVNLSFLSFRHLFPPVWFRFQSKMRLKDKPFIPLRKREDSKGFRKIGKGAGFLFPLCLLNPAAPFLFFRLSNPFSLCHEPKWNVRRFYGQARNNSFSVPCAIESHSISKLVHDKDKVIDGSQNPTECIFVKRIK